MRRILIFFVNRFIRPIVYSYVSKPTAYSYKTASITVLPGVFHPRFFFSTKLLISCLERMDLRGKTFLELGAGSGLISILAAQAGALVTATDISKTAIENVLQNQKLNKVFFRTQHSDLFSTIPEQTFDVIVINPPYYKKDPVTEPDHAWYCGKNSEYFTRLFSDLGKFMHAGTKTMMVLADVCDINLIRAIAGEQSFVFILVAQKEVYIEKNFVFEIRQASGAVIKTV